MSHAAYVYPYGLAGLLYVEDTTQAYGVWDKPNPNDPIKIAVLIGPGYVPQPEHHRFDLDEFHPWTYRLKQGTTAINYELLAGTVTSTIGTAIQLTANVVVFDELEGGGAGSWVGGANTGVYGVLIGYQRPSMSGPEEATPLVYFYDDTGIALQAVPSGSLTLTWQTIGGSLTVIRARKV